MRARVSRPRIVGRKNVQFEFGVCHSHGFNLISDEGWHGVPRVRREG